MSLSKTDYAYACIKQGYWVRPVHDIDENGKCTCLNTKCKNAGNHPIITKGTNDLSTVIGWLEEWPDAKIEIAFGWGQIVELELNPIKQDFYQIIALDQVTRDTEILHYYKPSALIQRLHIKFKNYEQYLEIHPFIVRGHINDDI